MKSLWRIASVLGCVVLICAAAIVWHVVGTRARKEKLKGAADVCRRRAEHGDATAQYELARMYYQGKGVNQDYAQALSWYRKAADQGNAKAEYGIGAMYDKGEGVRQDYAEALSWSRKAADQGDPRAEYALAYFYQEGRGVARDPRAAIEWCRKSAAQGYARAQYALGSSYFEGWGVPQNYSSALEWFQKAADQGYAEAQTYLGYMYSQGKGVKRDDSEAVRWYGRAAEQGNAQAQYNLGYMYYYGLGVPKDRVEAFRLFRAAGMQGNEEARRFTASLKSRLVCGTIILALEFLASLYFAVIFVKSGQSCWSRMQIVTGITALLLMAAFVLDLFWYSYVGHLQSLNTITALYFARHLLAGLCAALLLFMVFPTRSKTILVSAGALFAAHIIFQTVLYGLKHIAPTIRLFCFIGFPIGMAIPPVIILWLDSKSARQLHGNDAKTLPITE